jgi:hypothetical protein
MKLHPLNRNKPIRVSMKTKESVQRRGGRQFRQSAQVGYSSKIPKEHLNAAKGLKEKYVKVFLQEVMLEEE